ncbi:MAG TPA: hypothetical protein VFZ21_27910 [Gemmatimonadaceae bacterium]|jgi:hypothetical protein|nr:hypothetical protein [Gemmatimonadaceae bacterium]
MSMRIKVGRMVGAGAVMTLLGACNAEGGREDYSESPDSGAVAPAMRLDTSASRHMPDSTAGGAQRTGRPGSAGDTLGSRGQPVGTTGAPRPDTTRRRP